MADNYPTVSPARNVATDQVTYSGDTADLQLTRLTHVTGAEGSKVVTDVSAVLGSPAAAALSTHVFPATTGGWTTTHITLAAGANATRIKASPGTVGGIDITNVSSTAFFVQFHNSTANPPVLNSTAVVRKIGCQAGVPRYVSFGDIGLAFSTGIGITITTGVADTSITTVAADAGIVDIHWI